MKALKICALVLGGIVALGLLAVVAIYLFVDPSRYRARIEQEVTQATGRPFAIQGDIKLSVYPWVSLDVGKVSLGNPEGFAAEPQISAQRLRLGARLLPLLGGHLQISRVSIDGLNLTLVKRADGHSNWEDLGSHGKAKPEPGADHGSLADASLAGFDLSGASIELRDEADRSVTRIRELELHTGALGVGRPSDIALGARIDSGAGSTETRLDFHARANVDTEQSLVTLADLKLSLERRSAAGATPMPLSMATPRLELNWKTGTLAPATLALRAGELPLTVDVAGEQLFGERRLSGRVKMAEQPLRKLAAGAGITLPVTREPGAFTRVAFATDFELHGKTMALSNLDMMLDRSRLRGQLTLTGGTRAALDAELRVDSVDLDGYRAPAPASAAPAAAQGPTPIPFELLRSVDARIRVTFERATIAGLALTDLRIPVTLHDGDLRLTPSADAFGGTAKLAMHLDASHEPATLEVATDLSGVDVGAVIKGYAKSDRLSGRANAQSKLTGSGSTDKALIDSLEGPISLDISNGALEGLDVTYELERAQSLLRREVPPARSGPQRTAFTALSARSRLAHGVLTTDPLQIETSVLRVSGKGTFRLSDQAVDYQIAALVRQVPASGSGASLGSLKSLEIPITVSGTVHDYKVRPDVSGILKGRAKQELENQKDKLRESLKDKLKDLFH
jgi:AsmA protein